MASLIDSPRHVSSWPRATMAGGVKVLLPSYARRSTVRPKSDWAMKKDGGSKLIVATTPVGVVGTNVSGRSMNVTATEPVPVEAIRRVPVPTMRTCFRVGSGIK